MKFDYEPTIPNVRGIHIGVVVAILFLLWWFFCRGYVGFNPMMTTGVNGDGAATYLNVADTTGWIEYQYNSLGAFAGAGVGGSN